MVEHHMMVDRREIRALVAQLQRKTLTFDELENHLTVRLRGWGIVVIDVPKEPEGGEDG